MALSKNTGHGRHPLISSWFWPNYHYPHNSIYMLRKSVGIESNTADNSAWSDFFFPTQLVTGTGVTAQAICTLTAAGTIPLVGAGVITQAAQVIAAAGTERFSGVSAPAQAGQTIVSQGLENFSATAILDQGMQTIVANGIEEFTGIATISQTSQTDLTIGQEDFSGIVVLDQTQQVLLGDGTIGSAALPITGDVTIDQPICTLNIIGEVGTVATGEENKYQRAPLFIVGLYPEKAKRQLRFLESETEQKPQYIEARGTVTKVIHGETGTIGKTQRIMVAGRKNTFARDLKAILELLESEAA